MAIIARSCRTAPWISTAGLALGHAGRCAAALVGLCLVALVALVSVLSLGAGFARAPARRRACLQALEAVLALAPWCRRRDER